MFTILSEEHIISIVLLSKGFDHNKFYFGSLFRYDQSKEIINMGFFDSRFQTEPSCVKYIYKIMNHRLSPRDKNDIRRKEKCCKEPVFIWNW